MPNDLPTSKTVTWREIVTEMGERFTSLNSIPVERTTIRRHEWEAILQKLHDVMPSDETTERQLPPHDYTHPDWQGNGVTKFWTEDSLRAYSAVSSSSPLEPSPTQHATEYFGKNLLETNEQRFRVTPENKT